ncbi:MAG TPA: DUF4136 domain-containing protein [Terriglobales bacterium]|nr:DUF4136 domain-containing protein [Terriglobales bacterium]
MALLCAVGAFAQEPAKTAPEAAKPTPPLSPLLRLNSAKSVFLKSSGGSDIPYNVISSSMEGWGRYEIVKSPDKADLVMDITAPSDGGGGVSVSSSTSNDQFGRPQDSVSSSRDLSSGGTTVRLVIYDARSKAPLWSASEEAKGAMRQRSREDNLVKASEKLFTKFHDRIEPPANAQ